MLRLSLDLMVNQCTMRAVNSQQYLSLQIIQVEDKLPKETINRATHTHQARLTARHLPAAWDPPKTMLHLVLLMEPGDVSLQPHLPTLPTLLDHRPRWKIFKDFTR